MKWVGGINDIFGGWNDIIIIRRVAVYSVTFDSSITRSIGGVVDFDALPAVDRAPLMAWIEDLSSENASRHLSQLIVELYG